MIYFQQNGPTHIPQTQSKHKNTTHTTASGTKTKARSNQREARAGATTGRPAAACLTNSRRRKATGLAPDLCYKEHLKPLTGTTTYEHNNKIKPKQRHPRKLPTCQVIRALTCCACLFTSLSYEYVLTNPTNHPTKANNTPQNDPLRPTGTQNWTVGTDTGVTGTKGDGSPGKTDGITGAGRAPRPQQRLTTPENPLELDTIIARRSNCRQTIEQLLEIHAIELNTTTTTTSTQDKLQGHKKGLLIAQYTQRGTNGGLLVTDRCTQPHLSPPPQN